MAIAVPPRPQVGKGHFGAGAEVVNSLPSKPTDMVYPYGVPRHNMSTETVAARMPSYGSNFSSMSGPHEDRNSARNSKGRNKLGYHRSSVACGHCRRRKIRCKVESKDASGRCESCIKLKRECEFQPVDQQSEGSITKPNGSQQQRSKSRALASSRIKSTSSSPAVKPEYPATSTQSQPHYQTISSLPTSQDMGPPVLKSFSDVKQPYGYGGWPGSEPPSPKTINTAGAPIQPWKQFPSSPTNIPYGQFAQHATEWPQATDGLASASGHIRNEDEWEHPYHSPTRTLSYGSEESVAPQYMVLGEPDAHRGSYDRRSSMGQEMYPPPMSNSMMGHVDSHPPQNGLPVSTRPPAVPTQAYGWQQQPYQYHGKTSAEYGPTWYVNAPYQPPSAKPEPTSSLHAGHGMDEAHYFPGTRRN